MRLVRLGDETSEVGTDVRAALASWGRGDTVVGGVALIGCRPPDCPRPADAVVVLPRGILVVVGVDLPDPAVRLDAPLSGQWKTDGWPLVRPDGAVNPAVEALETAAAIGNRLEAKRVEPLPVATIVAIGPYVSQVFQPTSDLHRGVRILHPEPMTLLTAARELAVYSGPCSVGAARRVLDALQPDHAGLRAIDLTAEGFPDTAGPGLAAASTTLIPRISDASKEGGARAATGTAGRRIGRPAARRSGQVLRWFPVGAAVLVALLLITGIVVAVVSAGTSTGADGAPNRTSPSNQAQQAAITVDGIPFAPKGENQDGDCAAHTYGDVQVWLQRNPCKGLVRLRFESTSDGQKAAVLVAVLRFSNSASATELRKVADKPGSGAVADPSSEGTAWPDGGQPTFESAAFASGREGNSVKLVQAVWMGKQSTPDDKVLKDLAIRALELPIPD